MSIICIEWSICDFPVTWCLRSSTGWECDFFKPIYVPLCNTMEQEITIFLLDVNFCQWQKKVKEICLCQRKNLLPTTVNLPSCEIQLTATFKIKNLQRQKHHDESGRTFTITRKSIYTKLSYGHKERKFTNLFMFVRSMPPFSFVPSHVLSLEDEWCLPCTGL